MALFAVTLRYHEGSEEARAVHQDEHLSFLQEQFDAGRLVVSGPTETPDGARGALLILRRDSARQAAELMDAEPFNREGLVDREVRSWTPKFGAARLEEAR